MSEEAVTRLSDVPEQSVQLPKFYPCSCLRIFRPRQTWRAGCPVGIASVDSVFNIIFKKIYSVRYMEVSGEYCGNETRHDA